MLSILEKNNKYLKHDKTDLIQVSLMVLMVAKNDLAIVLVVVMKLDYKESISLLMYFFSY